MWVWHYMCPFKAAVCGRLCDVICSLWNDSWRQIGTGIPYDTLAVHLWWPVCWYLAVGYRNRDIGNDLTLPYRMLWLLAVYLTNVCFDVCLKGGQLIDVIRARHGPLPCDEVLQAFYQTCSAVHHMHRQRPPIIHRDLKVLLIRLLAALCWEAAYVLHSVCLVCPSVRPSVLCLPTHHFADVPFNWRQADTAVFSSQQQAWCVVLYTLLGRTTIISAVYQADTLVELSVNWVLK